MRKRLFDTHTSLPRSVVLASLLVSASLGGCSSAPTSDDGGTTQGASAPDSGGTPDAAIIDAGADTTSREADGTSDEEAGSGVGDDGSKKDDAGGGVTDGGLMDAPVDATSADSGFDASSDAHPDDGSIAAETGAADAADAGSCTVDTDCPSQDCECQLLSGSCASSSGHCGAGMAVFATPNGPSGSAAQTFTLPAACTSIYIEAWGAAGASLTESDAFDQNAGGAGGFVGGSLSGLVQGTVVNVWVGQAGSTGTGGAGWQSAGVPANGGNGNGNEGQTGVPNGFGGGGGGLTTMTIGSTSIYVGAGAGGQDAVGGEGGGAPGAIAMYGGYSGAGLLECGGGAPAGVGASALNGGVSSAPAGFIVTQGQTVLGVTIGKVASAIAEPPNTSAPDYVAHCVSAGRSLPNGGVAGSGCVVVRCE